MRTSQEVHPGHLESGKDEVLAHRKSSGDGYVSHVSIPPVGQQELASVIEPHDTYEGKHRWDPHAEWTPAEERAVVRKTDFLLLSWVSLMVSQFSATDVGTPQAKDLLTCFLRFSFLGCNLTEAISPML